MPLDPPAAKVGANGVSAAAAAVLSTWVTCNWPRSRQRSAQKGQDLKNASACSLHICLLSPVCIWTQNPS